MKKPELVDNWRSAWRWLSMHCMALALALEGAWRFLPEDLRGRLPDEWVSTISIVLLVLGIAGRLIKQEKSHAGTDQ